MIQPLVILGAGGFARETLDVVDAINAVSEQFDMRGFIVDADYARPGETVNDKPILGDFDWLAGRPDVLAVCGVGAPHIRRQMILKAAQMGIQFAVLVHPRATLTRWVELGAGTIITAGCVLTNQIRLGQHVHLNLNCTVGHDALIDDFATLSPGIHVSGGVHIEEGAYIGTGAALIEKVTIGKWSTIGAGSAVVRDIPPNVTAVGVPAKVIKERADGWHLS